MMCGLGVLLTFATIEAKSSEAQTQQGKGGGDRDANAIGEKEIVPI